MHKYTLLCFSKNVTHKQRNAELDVKGNLTLDQFLHWSILSLVFEVGHFSLHPTLSHQLFELAKTKLSSTIVASSNQDEVMLQREKKKKKFGVYFRCSVYFSLYRNVNPSHFEFYHDTLPSLAWKSVLFGSKSHGIQQLLLLSVLVCIFGWQLWRCLGHFSVLLILTWYGG